MNMKILTIYINHSFRNFGHVDYIMLRVINNIFGKTSDAVMHPKPMKRKFHLSRPVDMQRHWVNGDPIATAFFNSLSISFPHAEICMIDSIKPWREHVSDDMRDEIDAFVDQELNHSREHVAFNRGMDNSGYEIKSVEKDILNLVQSINLKDDLYRLQMTICMEHLTAVLSHELVENDIYLKNASQELKEMWIWHATEEIEHKAVAFDVWKQVTQDWTGFKRWYSRSLFFAIISYRFIKNRTKAQIHLLKQDGYSGWAAFIAMMRYGLGKNGLMRAIFKPWAQFFKPNFHPWDIDDRHLISVGESKFVIRSKHDKTMVEPVVNEYKKGQKKIAA